MQRWQNSSYEAALQCQKKTRRSGRECPLNPQLALAKVLTVFGTRPEAIKMAVLGLRLNESSFSVACG